MKKTMLLVTIGFVVITTVIFFIYPYLQYSTPTNLSGVYIRYAEHEYGKEWDTLTVYKQDATINSYQVIRRWKYERVLDGAVQLPEYKKQTTKIRLLDNDVSFVEEETGISYSYNDDKNELTAGTTIYKRIK